MLRVSDNKDGSIRIDCAFTSIKLRHGNLLKLLKAHDTVIDAGDGLKLVVQLEYGLSHYHLSEYDRNGGLLRHIFMTHAEWSEVMEKAIDLNPPRVEDEVCTLCDEYVPDEYHFGCSGKMKNVECMLCTPFGEELSEILQHLVGEKYIENYGDLPKTYARLVKAYGYITRDDLTQFIPENVMCCSGYVQNVKALLLSHIIPRVGCDYWYDA